MQQFDLLVADINMIVSHSLPYFSNFTGLKFEKESYSKFVCLIVHKCVWGDAPESLKDMIVMSNPRTQKLVEKKFQSAFGRQAFSCAGPKLWNCLPLKI